MSRQFGKFAPIAQFILMTFSTEIYDQPLMSTVISLSLKNEAIFTIKAFNHTEIYPIMSHIYYSEYFSVSLYLRKSKWNHSWLSFSLYLFILSLKLPIVQKAKHQWHGSEMEEKNLGTVTTSFFSRLYSAGVFRRKTGRKGYTKYFTIKSVR